jgi:2-pyrone-4,6-dicarboxylate lactonase
MGPPFTDAVPFAQAMLEGRAGPTLWGTDWPHPNIKKHMPNDGDLVDLIPLFMPDEALQRKVLVDNPNPLRLHRLSRQAALIIPRAWSGS